MNTTLNTIKIKAKYNLQSYVSSYLSYAKLKTNDKQSY